MKLMIELMSTIKGFEDIEASKTLSQDDKGAMIWEMFSNIPFAMYERQFPHSVRIITDISLRHRPDDNRKAAKSAASEETPKSGKDASKGASKGKEPLLSDDANGRRTRTKKSVGNKAT